MENFVNLFIIIVVIIHLYGILIHLTKVDDPLLIRSKYLGNFINGWSLSHLLFFMYIGYTYPLKFNEAMLLGISWEFYEHAFGTIFPKLFPNIAFQIDKEWTSWCYGCYEDIIMNFIGFKIGSYLKYIVK